MTPFIFEDSYYAATNAWREGYGLPKIKPSPTVDSSEALHIQVKDRDNQDEAPASLGKAVGEDHFAAQ